MRLSKAFGGNERDGGNRKHEGIDIFAKKGTPVVAVAEGRVSSTGNRGLGGKQVWLRTGIFSNSIYYAHLDSIAVVAGTKVKAGDTLGFVGNTGNAQFTPPHLHFGIYQNHGAIDPKPFVYQTQNISAKEFSKSFASNIVKVKSSKAVLRQGPTTDSQKLGELKAEDKVLLLGESKSWLHIQTLNNQKAFLHKSLVREIK